MGILQHNSERFAEIRLLDLVNIDTVITDLSVFNVIETVDQIGNGCFTCSCRSNKGYLLTRLCE